MKTFYFNFLSTFVYLITNLYLLYMLLIYIFLYLLLVYLSHFFSEHNFKGTDVHSYSFQLFCKAYCVHTVSYSPSPAFFLNKSILISQILKKYGWWLVEKYTFKFKFRKTF